MTHDIAAPDPKGSKTGHSGAHGPSWDPDSEVQPKPADCTCVYPRLVARNMTGHAPDCPTHARTIAEWNALGAQQRESLKAFYDREARTLTVRFTYLRKGHPRAALESVLASIPKSVFETEILDEH